MKKILTYVPAIAFTAIVFRLEQSKWLFLFVLIFAGLMVFAKYRRKQLNEGTIAYDERIHTNITKWSLRSMYGLNVLLLLILLLKEQQVLTFAFPLSSVIIYLLISLFIPFYCIPMIIKYF